MLESAGVVKPLPAGKWSIKIASGTQIPYVECDETGTKKGCMHVFQEAAAESHSASAGPQEAPDLDLEKVKESKTSAPAVPIAPIAGDLVLSLSTFLLLFLIVVLMYVFSRLKQP